MALSITLPTTVGIFSTSSVHIEIATESRHFVWVIWSGKTPVASEANVPKMDIDLPSGTYRLVLTFHGPAGTQAEISITSNGVTKTRKGSIGQNGSSSQLTRQFSVSA